MAGSALNYFLFFITAMVTTLLLVPPIKRLARVTGAMDEPNERKVHTVNVPSIGGLAMFFGFAVTFLIYLGGFESFRGIFLGMVIIVIVGLIDDSLGLEPKLKLAGQIVAALAAMILSDVNIDFLGGVVGSNYNLGFLSIPLTVFWIVGITNAINLSDGLDGLAGGISLIAFISFGFLAYQRGDMAIFTLCLILTGCILGFLRYNTHPAEIFMGDTGSLFLGYSLGTLSIAGNFKSLTAMALLTPVLVLLVPIADTLWAIIRRIRQGRSPFSADKMHFHHKLLNRGMDQHQTVSFIYGISAALSVCAVAMANSTNLKFLLVPILVLSIGLFFAQVFGVLDFSKWARAISLRIDHWFPFQSQSLWARISLRAIQAGTAIYMTAFLLGLSMVPLNILFVATTTVTLIFYLAITKGPNGQSYMIFSFFFLAAVVVLVTSHLQNQDHTLSTTFAYLEPAGFILMTLGVFGKIIFKKNREFFLSTPLEFFVFLVLVSIALVPQEIRIEYNLVQHTLRTFLLFLSFKILALAVQEKAQATVPAPIS